MPLVFISYKRSQGTTRTARELFLRLTRHFGDDAIFWDEASISYSKDIRESIRERLVQCSTFLVLIDNLWKDCLTKDRDRYPTPRSRWIGLEIEEALKSDKIQPFPVLLDDTEMPSEFELPEQVRRIALVKALPFRRQNFPEDFSRLVRELEKHVKGSVRPLPKSSVSKSGWYDNEVRYCLEDGDGKLSEVGSRYLSVLAEHLNLSSTVEQPNIANRAQRSYNLYKKFVASFSEDIFAQGLDDKLNLNGEALRYIDRLVVNLGIPDWQARQIYNKSLEKLENARKEAEQMLLERMAQEASRLRVHALESRLLDDILDSEIALRFIFDDDHFTVLSKAYKIKLAKTVIREKQLDIQHLKSKVPKIFAQKEIDLSRQYIHFNSESQDFQKRLYAEVQESLNQEYKRYLRNRYISTGLLNERVSMTDIKDIIQPFFNNTE